MSVDFFQGVPLLRLEHSEHRKTGLTMCAWLAPECLRDVARFMLDKEYFLEDVSILETAEGFVAVYHFDHFTNPGRIALRVVTGRDEPELPSIADIYQGASWHERESHDFFGVSFAGNDNLLPLLLPGETQLHPLRKEEQALKPLMELIEPGEVVREEPEFTLFTPPAKSASEHEQGAQSGKEETASTAAPEP